MKTCEYFILFAISPSVLPSHSPAVTYCFSGHFPTHHKYVELRGDGVFSLHYTNAYELLASLKISK